MDCTGDARVRGLRAAQIGTLSLREAATPVRQGRVLQQLEPATLPLQMQHEYIDYKIFRAIDCYLPSAPFRGRITIVRNWDSPIDLNQEWFDHTTEGGDVHVVSGHHGNWLDDHIDDFIPVLKTALN